MTGLSIDDSKNIFFGQSIFLLSVLSLCRLVDGCLSFVFGWNVDCCFGFAGRLVWCGLGDVFG